MSMMTQDEYRAKYVKDKDRLLSFIGKTKEKFDNFNFNNNLDELKTNVVSNNFSIVVIGEFSSGKSTFLNALMGERYLPSYKRETTATINYLKHKDLANNGDKCLVITYNDGRKEELNLSFEAIQKYTTTDDKDKIDVAKEIKYIEIFIDSKFLKDNTMLVDTPGLNGIEEGLLDITMNQISKSHSCIYLFNSNAPGTKTDFDVLNDLNKKFNSILIVLNQIDQIKEDEGETVDSIINTLKINFKKQIPDAKIPEIFPLSSLAALVARHPRDGEVNMPGDKKKYSSEERKNLLLKSRIEEFESRLWRFLTQGEKTRNEILEPLKKLKEIINQKLIDLKEENEALENKEDTAELQKEIERYEDEVKNISEDFNNQKKQITSIVEDKIENSKNLFKIENGELKEKFEKKIDLFISEEDFDKDNLDEFVKKINDKLYYEYKLIFNGIEGKFTKEINKETQNLFNEAVQIKMGYKDQIEKLDKPQLQPIPVFDLGITYEQIDKKLSELKQKKYEINMELDKHDIETIKVSNKKTELEKIEAEIKENEEKINNIYFTFGETPRKDIRTKIEYEKIGRGGILGGIAYILVGCKHRQKEVEIVDDSRQKNYLEQKQKYQDNLENNIKELKAKKNEFFNQSGMSAEEILLLKKAKERNIDDLNEEQNKILNDYEKHRLDFIKKASKKVRYYLEDIMENYEKSIVEDYNKYYDNRKDEIIKTIIDVLSSSMQNQLNEKINRLNDRKNKLSKSVDEKNKIVETNTAIISDLSELYSDISEMFTEIESKEVDKIMLN